ncbi:MAG: hemolysin III family protein [Cytophagales bacterium]|nr:hemolysin III family protein [Cytophagales bacterium]
MILKDKIVKVPPSEEIANVFTHGVGLVLFFVGAVFLLIKAHDRSDLLEIISAYVFCGSLINLYLASTLYHAVSNPYYKSILHFGDHLSIFILIAGTYTPFLLVTLKDKIHLSFIITMWSIAGAGILYKLLFFGKYKAVSLAIYLAMGWMAIFKLKTFYEYLPYQASIWILVGGLFYSIGTYFYSKESIRYHHAIWHLFVLCGSASHFIAIYLYVY